MELNRVELLRQLELVSPGLAKRDIVEQSKCFVFRNGQIRTFNDEISCSIPTTLQVEGAIQSEGMLSILNKMTAETISVEQGEKELLLRAPGSRTGIVMEQDIVLPVDSVEQPTTWNKLPKGFCEAVDYAKSCASQDDTRFDTSCVHFHPNWIEAGNSDQMLRYGIKTGLKESQLVRATSVKYLAQLGVSHISLGDVWMHFKNQESGLIFSLRRYLEPYPDFTKFYDVQGDPLTFPGGLQEMADKASVFSTSSLDDFHRVLVDIKGGKIRIKGEGDYGWHQEIRKIDFKGELHFRIAPKLLIEFSNRANDCIITKSRMLVDGGKFKWVGNMEAVE